jgi:hypothetical protein
MGTFSEWLFYASAGVVFLFSIPHLNDNTENCQTIGCLLGNITGIAFLTFLPISIGLAIRHRRIKKEKAKQQTG